MNFKKYSHRQPLQECIPVGWVPPAHWLYLVVSYVSPLATMHTPLQPCMPPNHACCPQQPHMPPATMHAPQQPCMPPSNYTCPPATTHTPQQPHMSPSNHACPPGNHAHSPCGQNDTHGKNITLPQTSFAGGNKTVFGSVRMACSSYTVHKEHTSVCKMENPFIFTSVFSDTSVE